MSNAIRARSSSTSPGSRRNGSGQDRVLLPLLVASAIACFAASVALMLSGAAAPAAAAHLAFAAGVMPLIFGAMMHFVPVLTRSKPAAPMMRCLPFVMSAAGLLAVAAFVLPEFFRMGIRGGACLALAASLIMATWIARRAKAALGAPHPGLYWYLAAVLCLVLALVAALATAVWADQRSALRVFHLHLNTLGFVGLTAIGTLQVLLPTAVARPDKQASARLRSDLPLAVAGALLVAAGAAWMKPAAYAGMVLLLVPVVRLGTTWGVRLRREVCATHGAAPSLALALSGLAALLLAGAGHANGRLGGTAAIFGFVLAFLLPLVTGAVSQLLPLWLKPGAQTEWHREARATLCRYGGVRGLAFVAAGLSVVLGWREATWLAAGALAVFIGQLLRVLAFCADKEKIGEDTDPANGPAS